MPLTQTQIIEIFSKGMSEEDAYSLRCAVRAETIACAETVRENGPDAVRARLAPETQDSAGEEKP